MPRTAVASSQAWFTSTINIHVVAETAADLLNVSNVGRQFAATDLELEDAVTPRVDQRQRLVDVA